MNKKEREKNGFEKFSVVALPEHKKYFRLIEEELIKAIRLMPPGFVLGVDVSMTATVSRLIGDDHEHSLARQRGSK